MNAIKKTCGTCVFWVRNPPDPGLWIQGYGQCCWAEVPKPIAFISMGTPENQDANKCPCWQRVRREMR